MSTTVYRPQGTPGIYRGQVSKTAFDVILDRDQILWHHVQPAEGTTSWLWVPMRGWDVDRFEPDDVPEWVPQCPHDRICDTEADCDRLAREDERTWGR